MTAEHVRFGMVVMDHVIFLKKPRPSKTIVSLRWNDKNKLIVVSKPIYYVRQGATACFVCLEENHVLFRRATVRKDAVSLRPR